MKTINVNSFKHLGFGLTVIALFSFTLLGMAQNGKKIYVKQGNMTSFGTYDGVYFKGVANSAQYDCDCWKRYATNPVGVPYNTAGTANQPVSIGKPKSSGWWVFKHSDCPPLSVNLPYANGLITNAAGCDPTNMFNVHETMTRMVIPFYVYPTGTAWDDLQAQANTLGDHMVVIANPASGPGGSKDAAYETQINALRAKKAKVIGYVALSFGAKTDAVIKKEITDWDSLYNIDGIFFDEAHFTNAALYSKYATHFQAVQTNTKSTAQQLVVFNPGVIPASNTAWNGHDGLICTFEAADTAFPGMQSNLQGLNLDQRKRSVILIHGLQAQNWEGRYNWLMSEGFNNFYFTSVQLAQHPWNFQSPYLSNMVNRTQAIP